MLFKEFGQDVDYIPIENNKIPYSFSIKLDDRTYTITIKYNEIGHFYTADLSIAVTGEILCYGDIVRYGRPLFGSVEDNRFPIPVIIPYCLTDEESEVTAENFGETVKLYLHERRA